MMSLDKGTVRERGVRRATKYSEVSGMNALLNQCPRPRCATDCFSPPLFPLNKLRILFCQAITDGVWVECLCDSENNYRNVIKCVEGFLRVLEEGVFEEEKRVPKIVG